MRRRERLQDHAPLGIPGAIMPETDASGRLEECPTLALPPVSAGLVALDRLIDAHGPQALLGDSPTAVAAEELHAVVRVLCAEARRTDPGRAERLVIALRAAWPTLPAVRRLPAGDGSAALLDRVVRRCIAEFYGPRPTAKP